MVDTKGLNKADVLAALYNASRPQGMGFLSYDPTPMSREIAESILKQIKSFDYLKGRVMKVDLEDDDGFQEYLYDRDNGNGAAQRAIDALRASNSPNPVEIQAAHLVGKEAAADKVMESVHKPCEVHTEEDGTVVFRVGLADAADALIPAVDKALNK